MQKKSDILPLLAGVAIAGVLVAGVLHLFLLRFAGGDIYPAYSSLRADPIGAKVYYHSLETCPEIAVARNHMPLEQADLGPDTTLLLLGVPAPAVSFLGNASLSSSPTVAWLGRFMRKGGRLVVTLLPLNTKWLTEEDEEKPPKKDLDKPAPLSKEGETGAEPGDPVLTGDEEDNPRKQPKVDLTKEWGFDLNSLHFTNEVSARLHPECPTEELPRVISCHSSLVFTNLGMAWQTVYQRDGNPVIIERRLGAGSLVLSTLSYFASNEALKNERHPALLTWIAGDRKRVVFDEHHHGITESKGIAMLAREYRLHGFAAGFLLLAILFVWQQSVSLVPPDAMAEQRAIAATALGKGSASGLANLLRHNVRARDILAACLTEWKKSTGRMTQVMQQKARRMEAVLEEEGKRANNQRDAVRAYNEMRRILAERRTETHTK